MSISAPEQDYDQSNEEISSKVIGFMGPPGIGKSVAMNIVEHEPNRVAIGEMANLGRPLTVGVARKSTTRASRTEDRMKESGLKVGTGEGEFNPDTMVGVYTLSNNGAMYGYRPEELNKQGVDVLIAEPSLHHLTEMKEFLQDRLETTLLVATRDYRLARLGGRGTEDMAEVRRRVIEGDSQIIMAEILGAPLGKSASELTDARMTELFMEIRNAAEGEVAGIVAKLEQYLIDYVQDPDAEGAASYAKKSAANFAEEVRHLAPKQGQSYIENVVTVDDSFLSSDVLNEGKFREAILEIVAQSVRSKMESVLKA